MSYTEFTAKWKLQEEDLVANFWLWHFGFLEKPLMKGRTQVGISSCLTFNYDMLGHLSKAQTQ